MERGAVIQELSGKLLNSGGNELLRRELKSLRHTIDDANTPEIERKKAQEELDELTKRAYHKISSQASEAVERVSKAIRRLRKKLQKTESKPSVPNEALRLFGEHIQKYILRPSSSHAKTDYPGCFTYEPPKRVVWADG